MGKEVKAAIAAGGVKDTSCFPFLLSWIELGPLGDGDAHFAIHPPPPCQPETTPESTSAPPSALAPKPTSRAEQRVAETKRGVEGVSEAVNKAARTEASRLGLANDAAHREAYEVAVKAHKARIKAHQLDINAKRALYDIAEDGEEKALARIAYREVLNMPPCPALTTCWLR